jgi:tetratricopeptide (TPR) repeat protein
MPTSGDLSRGTLTPSTRLGRYVVLDELGEGRMGRVYAAYDPELDRRIALELLRPELAARADPSMGRARLLREAQAMARLSHPNVLTVHDVGEVDPQAALAIQEARLGPEHPALVQQHGGIANVHHAQGRFDEALAHLERALAIAEAQTDPDQRELASLLNNLGNVLSIIGEAERALEALMRSLAIRKASQGEASPDVAQSLDNIGATLVRLGRHEQALARHEEALAMRKRIHGEDHPLLAYSLHGIGASRLALGQSESAIEPLERALEQTSHDRPRARELAMAARARSTSSGHVALTEEIDRWLAGRAL